MNLSPKWVSILKDAGWEVVHWSEIGEPNSTDHEILGYAKSNGYVIFTHDLDFATILAATKADFLVGMFRNDWSEQIGKGGRFHRNRNTHLTNLV